MFRDANIKRNFLRQNGTTPALSLIISSFVTSGVNLGHGGRYLNREMILNDAENLWRELIPFIY